MILKIKNKFIDGQMISFICEFEGDISDLVCLYDRGYLNKPILEENFD